jgi:hypothetical protein
MRGAAYRRAASHFALSLERFDLDVTLGTGKSIRILDENPSFPLTFRSQKIRISSLLVKIQGFSFGV